MGAHRSAPGTPRHAALEARSSHLRASDADRERAVSLLREHAAAGRLGFEELEDRVGRAHAARTLGDLRGLVTDLPSIRMPEDRARDLARRRAALGAQLRSYTAVMALLVGIWAVSGAGYFWPVWPMLGWGLALAPCVAATVGPRGRRPRRTLA